MRERRRKQEYEKGVNTKVKCISIQYNKSNNVTAAVGDFDARAPTRITVSIIKERERRTHA